MALHKRINVHGIISFPFFSLLTKPYKEVGMGRTCPFVSLRRWDFIDDILIGCGSSSLSISSHYMGLVEMDGDLFCMDYLGFHSDGVVVTLSFSKPCP